MACSSCGTHGAWAIDHKFPKRFCKCGALEKAPPEQKLLYKYLVEPVLDVKPLPYSG